MNKVVDETLLRKTMTKKAYIELQKSRRATNGFNTGTRTMKTEKCPSRQMRKEATRKMVAEY